MQGARSNGMAHAISSLRATPQMGCFCGFFLSAHVDAAVDGHGGAGHKAGQGR